MPAGRPLPFEFNFENLQTCPGVWLGGRCPVRAQALGEGVWEQPMDVSHVDVSLSVPLPSSRSKKANEKVLKKREWCFTLPFPRRRRPWPLSVPSGECVAGAMVSEDALAHEASPSPRRELGAEAVSSLPRAPAGPSALKRNNWSASVRYPPMEGGSRRETGELFQVKNGRCRVAVVLEVGVRAGGTHVHDDPTDLLV